MESVIPQVSEPYRRMDLTFELKMRIFVFGLMFLKELVLVTFS